MRVLSLCVPGVGHVAMALPLCRALRQAGHEVRLATGADFTAQAERAGLTAVPVGPTRAEAGAERMRRHPDPGFVRPEDQQRFHLTKVWAGIYAPATLPGLLREIEDWRPDLLVYDIAGFAGPLACALTGVPGVSHSFGPAFPRELQELAGDAVAPLWADHGLTAPVAGGMRDGPHVDVWPAALGLPDDAPYGTVLPMRARREPPPPGRPDYLEDRDGPLVHLTLGTIFNHNVPLLTAVLDGLHRTGVTVVVTTGPDQDPAVLGDQPYWVRTRRFVPHEALLPHCDLVICHAGAGTTLAALEHGVPTLLLPQAADGFRVAEGCVRAGAGLRLLPGEATPESVRRAVVTLLGTAHHRERARALRDVIARMPAPEDVARELAEHARAGAGVR